MIAGALSGPVPKRRLPPPCLALSAAGATVCATHPVSPSLPSGAVPASAAARLYEIVIHNDTGRHFKLTGPAQPLFRKVPQGRLVRLEPLLLPANDSSSSQEQVTSTAQAVFGASAHSAKEDALEFTLSFMDTSSEEGFTVRVHAHARSPLRSDAIASGQGLDVSSVLESVPRLMSRPPPGYAATALGIYRKPERDEASRVGTLTEGQEVLVGRHPAQGRWMHISAPLEGWIQARTRDDRPLLEQAPGQPNMRQVVSIHPREPGVARAAVASAAVCLSREEDTVQWPATSWAVQEPEPWTSELVHFKKSPALSEAIRLDKEASILEARSLLGIRARKALVGALPHKEI